MSYDRYVAICKPLYYTTIVSSRVCILLVFSSWLAGFLIIFPPIILLLRLDFCGSNIVDHFICDASPILQLSCRNTPFLELMALFLAVVTLMVTLTLVILSYTYIIQIILRIPSASQRKKAFTSCSSHMIIVSLFYGSCIFMYIKPSARERVTLSKGVVVLSTSLAPLLNPFIYTLKNQQVSKPSRTWSREWPFPQISECDHIKKKKVPLKRKLDEKLSASLYINSFNTSFHSFS